MSASSELFVDATLTGSAPTPTSSMEEYTRLVGQRLRRIRHERLYSLKDVERESNDEFKSSVISAYERGERMMSVQRLDRLAQFYDVPVSQLLPRDPAEATAREAAEVAPKLVVRVERLNQLEGEPFDRFRQLVGSIVDQRRDGEATVVTLRADDLKAVASMFDVSPDEMADRLTLLDLLA